MPIPGEVFEARIVGLALAHPPHRVPQAEVREFARRVFAGRTPQLERLLGAFDGAAIDERYLALPLDRYPRDGLTPGGRNDRFLEVATKLCEEAAAAALDDAGVRPPEVTHVILVTSTGFATPTLETAFGPRIGLRANVRRIPLWGLGCGGGASGLALARELCAGGPAVVLLVAVELCSLTFVPADASPANVVACALFGDGGAAAVVTGGGPGGLRLGRHRETLLPDSRDVMGWRFTDAGLEVVFLRRIPEIVRTTYRASVEAALSAHGMGIAELRCLATHPGGRRVVDAQQEVLGLPAERFDAARAALRSHGNVSSVSVFQVLDQLRQRDLWDAPGILSAFGPGFTSHVLVLPGARGPDYSRIHAA